MYNHIIICTCGQNEYQAICESAPTKEETILFWPDDFEAPPEDKETLRNDLIKWANSQNFKYRLLQGKGR